MTPKIKAKVSPLRLLKASHEFMPIEEVGNVPRGRRGIYVLYKEQPHGKFDVVYVGMAAQGGIRPRLLSHRSKKRDLWSHCSIFEVWDNIRPDEIKELEGIFRHIYRKDSRAAQLNVQRSFAKMKQLERLPLRTRRPR